MRIEGWLGVKVIVRDPEIGGVDAGCGQAVRLRVPVFGRELSCIGGIGQVDAGLGRELRGTWRNHTHPIEKWGG